MNDKSVVFLTDDVLVKGIQVYKLIAEDSRNYTLLSKSGNYRVISKRVFYVHRTRKDALNRMAVLVDREKTRLTREVLRLNDLLLRESSGVQE